MKKKESWIYRMAQLAVLESSSLTEFNKLEILRELMAKEDLALFVEKQEEEEQKGVAQAV